jgi:hypothetical protein
MADVQKTHTLVKKPSLNVRYLADYMAASEQKKRTILRDCKYRATARMIQHIEAKLAVANHIQSGATTPDKLIDRSNAILQKLASDQFEEDTNKHNAAYIKRFSEVLEKLNLPKADIQPAGKPSTLDVSGVAARLDPLLLLTRTTKTNKVRCGGIMLRYLKGKELPETTACFQSAAMLGLQKILHEGDGIEPEPGLAITIDAYAGLAHPAPSNAVYLFKEMRAACYSIAERWDAIQPPKNAVLG